MSTRGLRPAPLRPAADFAARIHTLRQALELARAVEESYVLAAPFCELLAWEIDNGPEPVDDDLPRLRRGLREHAMRAVRRRVWRAFDELMAVNLKNTLVANNASGDCSGDLISAGHNLI